MRIIIVYFNNLCPFSQKYLILNELSLLIYNIDQLSLQVYLLPTLWEIGQPNTIHSGLISAHRECCKKFLQFKSATSYPVVHNSTITMFFKSKHYKVVPNTGVNGGRIHKQCGCGREIKGGFCIILLGWKEFLLAKLQRSVSTVRLLTLDLLSVWCK